jgi:hypothetical protein
MAVTKVLPVLDVIIWGGPVRLAPWCVLLPVLHHFIDHLVQVMAGKNGQLGQHPIDQTPAVARVLWRVGTPGHFAVLFHSVPQWMVVCGSVICR